MKLGEGKLLPVINNDNDNDNKMFHFSFSQALASIFGDHEKKIGRSAHKEMKSLPQLPNISCQKDVVLFWNTSGREYFWFLSS